MSVNLTRAFRALLQNRLQAGLTLCGMSVGVAMVVIVSGLGRGAQLAIERQIESAGPTQITVRSGNLQPAVIAGTGEQDSGGGEIGETSASDALSGVAAPVGSVGSLLHAHESKQRPALRSKNRTPATPLGAAERSVLEEQIDNVSEVAGSVVGNVSVDADAGVPVRVIRAEGFEAAWPDMSAWRLLAGRWISADEHRDGASVAMVTSSSAARLWPSAAPLDRVLRIGGRSVRVVGVIGRNDTAPRAQAIVPSVQLPLPLAQSLLGRETFDALTVRTTSVGVTTAVAAAIRTGLRELHSLPDDTVDDFRVATQSMAAMPSMGLDPRLVRAVHSNIGGFEQAAWEEMARSLRQAGRTFTLLLAAAATVSLVVGGIGVMNIMLVSVAARTREIGLRMALGARTRDIQMQFLTEAVALSAGGALIGIVLGWIALVLATRGLHWSASLSPPMLVMALIVASGTGIAFGYGPARRAALLDPVVALRSE